MAALKADQERAVKEAAKAAVKAAKAAVKAAAEESRRKQQEQRRAAQLQARAVQQAAADLEEQREQQQGRRDRVCARAHRAQARLARPVSDQVGTAMAASGRALPLSATARTWRRPTGTSRGSSSNNQQPSGPLTKHSLTGNLGPADTGAK